MKTILKPILFAMAVTLCNSAFSQLDTVDIIIQDATLDQIYYEQDSFPGPTRLVFPNLTSVNGLVYFNRTVNLVSIDFPSLKTVMGYVYLDGNKHLKSLILSSLETVVGYVYVSQNTLLQEFVMCNLKEILAEDDQLPYYYIQNNTPLVDALPFCFSAGPPFALQLSSDKVLENEPAGTLIGRLTAESHYPDGALFFYLAEGGDDNQYFRVEGDQLFTETVFDYEDRSEYSITIGVYNQLGENVELEITIFVEDVDSEGIQVIEILDVMLDQIYYHQENFALPTRLVFPDLVSVTGFVYFHENTNLLSVELPQLTEAGGYFYFYDNAVLESIAAPSLRTVGQYVSVNQNTALNALDLCALKEIVPEENEPSYYSISGNTPAVDQQPFCFSSGAPSDLALSGTTVIENSDIGSYVGKFTADSNYPDGSLSYYFTEENMEANEAFRISNDSLFTGRTFDFETQASYEISVGVYNQLGERVEQMFKILIEDVMNEGVQTVEVMDTVLDQIYFHQESFTQPTRLTYPNLKRVNGFVYFHQNVNLLSVDLPQLEYTGDYFYCNENLALEAVRVSQIDTIHNYLYAYGNASLEELDICNLSHIISLDEDFDSYYFIEKNPVLDFSSTCLDSTILEFIPLDTLVQLNAVLVGSFEANTNDPIEYYFIDDSGEETTNDDFQILGNGLYLSKDISEYDSTNYDLSIGALRSSGVSDRTLNHKVELTALVNLDEKVVTRAGDLPWIDDVRVYPNPTNGSVILVSERRGAIQLIDVLGQVHLELELESGANNIDLSHLGAGIYFLSTNGRKLIRLFKI